MKRKLISILTIVCMLVTFMPTLAFAYDGDNSSDDPNTGAVLDEGIELSGGQESSENVIFNSEITSEPASGVVSVKLHIDIVNVDKGNAIVGTYDAVVPKGSDAHSWNDIDTNDIKWLDTERHKYFPANCTAKDQWVRDLQADINLTWGIYDDTHVANVQFVMDTRDANDFKEYPVANVKVTVPTVLGYYGEDVTNSIPEGWYLDESKNTIADINAKKVGYCNNDRDIKVYIRAGSATKKTEQLYLEVKVDGESQGLKKIYEGEEDNGASLSTKYAKDTSLCDRIGPHGGECDVHAAVENGVVKFSWIHHSNSNGYNPERMTADYQLVVDGKRIKASDLPITQEESSPDQYDIHVFTVDIDTSKMGDVIVHYVDEDYNEIEDRETLTNHEEEEFNPNDIEIKDIENYVAPTIVGDIPTEFTVETQDVYVVYRHITSAIIHYVDEDGNTLAEDYAEIIKYNDPFARKSPEIEGYELVNKVDEIVKTRHVTEPFEYTVIYKVVKTDIPDEPNTPDKPTKSSDKPVPEVINSTDIPNTADPFHLFIWGMLFVAAGIGIYVTRKFRA